MKENSDFYIAVGIKTKTDEDNMRYQFLIGENLQTKYIVDHFLTINSLEHGTKVVID